MAKVLNNMDGISNTSRPRQSASQLAGASYVLSQAGVRVIWRVCWAGGARTLDDAVTGAEPAEILE